MHPHDVDPTVLPWSRESETGVLGALMLNPQVWDAVGDILEPKQFFDSRHAQIYVVISGLVNACKPVDVISVWSAIEQAGNTEGIDLQLVHDIAQVRLSVGSARHYAEVIAERALLRTLRAGCHAPLGAWAELTDQTLILTAVLLSTDGTSRLEQSVSGAVDDPERIGIATAERLLEAGASALLKE